MKGSEHEVQDLMGRYRTAILTTRGSDGHFHARPMALRRDSSIRDLWFVTTTDTRKVQDLEENPECAVCMHDGAHGTSYVSISGHGSVVHDREKIHELWEPDWREWFPEGPDQANLTLIYVSPEHVEYVHPDGGPLRVLFSSMRSAIGRHRQELPPRKDLDVH